MNKIFNIVLTGGPGSGKTTVIDEIEKIYTKRNFKVIKISETATELINSAMSHLDKKITVEQFQELVLRTQYLKEEIMRKYLSLLDEETVIIIFDRGAIDGAAYIDNDKFQEILSRVYDNKNMDIIMNQYDLVINLVGSKEFYTTENNQARKEKTDEAIILGDKTLSSWYGHKRLKIVMPQPKIEDKIDKVTKIIDNFLKNQSVNLQKKYLIDMNDEFTKNIISTTKCGKIEQYYIKTETSVEKRLRKLEINNSTSYIYTESTNIGNKKHLLKNEYIKKEEYDEYGELIRIKKIRYYFSIENVYMHLDVFEGVSEYGILEIDSSDIDKMDSVLKKIKIIDDVTKNESYNNYNIWLKGKKVVKTKK